MILANNDSASFSTSITSGTSQVVKDKFFGQAPGGAGTPICRKIK
jgi:hypothetical protein